MRDVEAVDVAHRVPPHVVAGGVEVEDGDERVVGLDLEGLQHGDKCAVDVGRLVGDDLEGALAGGTGGGCGLEEGEDEDRFSGALEDLDRLVGLHEGGGDRDGCHG